MDPDAVVGMRSAANDLRDQISFAAILRNDLVSPAHGPIQTRVSLRAEKMDRIVPIVREDNISVAILVEIDKTEPGIVTGRIDNACAGRQTERSLLPTFFRSRPSENGGLRFIPNDQF